MNKVIVDFSKKCGKVKPMHAVNNGPLALNERGTSNFEEYKALGIPYARNHDASYHAGYGGEHTVDVHRIFKNFDADENDPKSYIFEPTDKYIKTTLDAGTKIFYRLGAAIEHGYKFGTIPPKDNHKWARICEHIIRHYNEGWANGFEYGIEYWEIWNEPEHDSNWQGTMDDFIEFYTVVSRHLKSSFPHLKIGGPAFTCPWIDYEPRERFMKAVKERNLPMDFFSYHRYSKTPQGIAEAAEDGKKILDELGIENAETILDEWNYIYGWRGDEWKYSMEMERGLKGSSVIAGTMALCQYTSIDMLMYYDARPCEMCGIFDPIAPWKLLKGYYPFMMFSELYALGESVKAVGDENMIPVAATDGKNATVMLTYFDDDDNAPKKEVNIELSSLTEGAKSVECYLLDGEKNMELVKTELINEACTNLRFEMTLFSTYLIKIKSK